MSSNINNKKSVEFKENLKDYILQIRPINKVSDSQFAVRCPICGDSRKNRNSTHFYIKIDVNEDTPILCNCYKCGAGGVMTSSILRALEIYDLTLTGELTTYNKRSVRKHTQYKTEDNELNLKIPDINPNLESNIIKKEYLENRLGIELSFEKLKELKTVFRLGDFLMENKIEKLTISSDKAMEIHEKYVGFVTINNETINFRQVMESNLKRYEKYSVYKGLMNTRKFYIIPTVVDLMTTETVTINIAEGVFDCWGIYFHVDDGGKPNSLYIAACGSGFRTILEYFIKLGLIGNVIVNIYSDNDQDITAYRYLKNFDVWFEKINIFYNERSHDYGVRREQIKLYKKKLK